ncbi:RNA 2',3'-cyclic phosphodiesterase [Qipengyuania sp. MTN3-11]|uniref:RNA 2',3'-cyclic phosphodiesterase n=1 Tax=Qipengyuania sp. MTN3-11 TaxID=3056557 RepID=UPI0036F40F2A
MSHRLFVAIRPPECIRDALIDRMEGLEGANWQGEDQLHLTLRFIGDADGPLAEDIAESLATIGMESFTLALAGVGHFERRGRPHTLWAGVMASKELLALADRVESACRRAGCAPETRKFAPHVTIARLNRSTVPIGQWIARNGDLRSEPWAVEAFTLYESHLGRGGALYEPVVRYQLKPA